MYIKTSILISALLLPIAAIADLNKPYKFTKGDRLAGCVERRIPLMDRTTVSDIRSYTKYDKHYVSLNSNSIYIEFIVTNNLNSLLNVIFVNNNHIERATSAERAKNTLQSISSSLVEPSIGYCSKMLGLNEEVKFSMLYIDPPYKSRPLKKVVKMSASGKFTLP